jgi:hypothetical protein
MTVIAHEWVGKPVQTVDFTAGQNFGEAQVVVHGWTLSHLALKPELESGSDSGLG